MLQYFPPLTPARARPKFGGTPDLSVPGYDIGFIATINTTFVANTTYYFPLYAATPLTFDLVACSVSSAIAATSARIALFNADLDDQPTSRVADFGTVSTATNGNKSISITQSIAAGNYLLAMNCDGAVQFVANRGGTGFTSGFATAQNFTVAEVGVVGAGFPSTGTAWTARASGTQGFFWPVGVRISTP